MDGVTQQPDEASQDRAPRTNGSATERLIPARSQPYPPEDRAVVATKPSAFARRRSRLAALHATHPLKTLAQSLCTLDERTDPGELAACGQAELASDVSELTQYLICRVQQRAAFALRKVPFEPSIHERTDAAWLRRAQRVEACAREALVAAFPPRPGAQLDMLSFSRAMAGFVGGELGTSLLSPVGVDEVDDLFLHGIPDSAAHLCFAESALMFLRLGLNPTFWDPTLHIFVGTTPFLLARYWDRTQRSWAAYRPEASTFVAPSQIVLAGIALHYAPMTRSQLAESFGDILAVALSDEPNLPRVHRTATEFT